MSTWCSGWNSHKTKRGHPGDFRREPFRTSCMDLEGRCGWFQNGKRVPIWKSRGGFPLYPGSFLLPDLCPSPSKAPVVRFPSKVLPNSASSGVSACRRTPMGTPCPKKTIGKGRDGSGAVCPAPFRSGGLKLGTNSSPTPPRGRDRYEERQTGLLNPTNGEP